MKNKLKEEEVKVTLHEEEVKVRIFYKVIKIMKCSSLRRI